MSNQEPQNPNKITEDAAVENRRRFIKGAGAVTPVILTLASSSVFGQELCLSQQMSGDTSGHPIGNCVNGNPPSFWKNPANRALWPNIPVPPGAGTSRYFYGTPNPGVLNPTCGQFVASTGTKFNDPLLGFATSTVTTSMRAILCAGATPSNNAVWTTALLNSLYVQNYILCYAQVMDLYKNIIAPPPPFPNTAAGRVAFLKTTWVGN